MTVATTKKPIHDELIVKSAPKKPNSSKITVSTPRAEWSDMKLIERVDIIPANAVGDRVRSWR
ncbi:hypothetical protein KXD40_003955 [Peronospora effusa]|nr:hypothetical protein KXD40_003956 [Peronospora effusa]UIZ23216.1 hypothetical protein KXD40_003957 [Peronospora effusa]UIZ23218.1 hypothetical protein KXD40_003955 [Peronospora effusa]